MKSHIFFSFNATTEILNLFPQPLEAITLGMFFSTAKIYIKEIRRKN